MSRHGRGLHRDQSAPVDHWHQVIVDPTIADAVLDRLVHTALPPSPSTARPCANTRKTAKRGKLDTDNAE